ncbi:Uncharacterised protein [Legionella beliardensis]|uniref:Uncharacterized protein n=2 Tax=Legionella beliardensis TaxID=91822 RepID=A0A378JU71_9GAMM|nr:hypothetical protein [Legionella beliardensis]STX55810.1 Uncharacterised protein [Legionella beliardensis]
MRYSIYLTKLVPLAVMLLGAILFFYPLQLIVQKNIEPLRKPGATIPLASGWIKVKNSILPTIKFNEGILGGQSVTRLGNTLYQISKYILPIGVAVTMIFSIFLVLGWELKNLIEKGFYKSFKNK